MSSYLYRALESDDYSERADVFGLDYYRRDGLGQDDFSRELVWMYVYGDEDLKQKYREKFSSMINQIFVEDKLDWDLITLYPTSTRNDTNSNLEDLVESCAEDQNLNHRQVIRRTRNISDNHEIEGFQEKVVNLEGSIDVDEVNGKNVILVDNITLSGASFLHATEKLMENGAENVACLCLGMGINGEVVDEKIDEKTASQAIQDRNSSVKARSLARGRMN